MAVIDNRDAFLQRLQERIGEDMKDEDVAFIEDITDTYDHMSGQSDTEWENKYNELDASWKKKYTDRFFQGDSTLTTQQVKEEQKENIISDGEPKTFEDLFKEREG